MPIPITEQEKRQRNLIILLVILALITFFTLYFGLKKRGEGAPKEAEIFVPPKEVKIDFEVLKNPIFEELEMPEKIPPPATSGKENPFSL